MTTSCDKTAGGTPSVGVAGSAPGEPAGLLVRCGEVLRFGRADQEVERQEQRLGEGKEDERDHHHQQDGDGLEQPPWRVRPGREQEAHEPDDERRFHGDEIEEIGADPVALVALEAKAADRTGREQARPAREDRSAPAVRAAQAHRAREMRQHLFHFSDVGAGARDAASHSPAGNCSGDVTTRPVRVAETRAGRGMRPLRT